MLTIQRYTYQIRFGYLVKGGKMKDYLPKYLRNVGRILEFKEAADGSFKIIIQLSIDCEESFYIYHGRTQPTATEKEYFLKVEEILKSNAERIKKQGGYYTTKQEIKGDRVIETILVNPTFGHLTVEGTPIGEIDITELSLQIEKSHHKEVIKVQPKDKNEEFILFDPDENGYDAMTINHGGNERKIQFTKKSKCRNCGTNLYNVLVTICHTGKNDVLTDLPDDINIRENWANAFDWISVDLVCANCGKRTKKWFESETM